MHKLMAALCLIVALTFPALVSAETYIGGMLGATLSASAGDNKIKDPLIIDGTKATNLSLDKSVMYGGKVGHYFEQARWLGVEAEVFTTTPDAKRQRVTLTAPSGASASFTQSRTDVHVTTVALNAMLRYPGERFQPYAGAGFGVFIAGAGGQSDTAPGLNALAGLRVKLTEHVGLFGEYKYNRAAFSFSPSSTSLGYDTTYQAHHVAVGVSYHF